MAKLTPNEIRDEVARRACARSAELTHRDVRRVLTELEAVMTEGIASGGRVRFGTFGSFYVRDRAGRLGVNPRTGECIEIAPSRVVKFSAGSALQQAVNGAQRE